jgi:hypothetical protein
MFHCSYEDNIKESIKNNNKIEDFLHTIMVISNPCLYQIRYKLAKEFITRMKKEDSVILYIVELAYGEQEFMVTEENNQNHLQLRANIPPLWHKENMINLGIEKLLPKNWKAVAWIDADVEFDNHHWASDTLKILNGSRDFVQLFTNCIDMDKSQQILNISTSFGYQFTKGFKKHWEGYGYWHPGYAWACNRKAYEQVGGIFERAILGSGDNIISNCFIKNSPNTLKKGMSNEYINYVAQYQEKFEGLKLGYVPGIIRHYFHGLKQNRRYYEREDILIKYKYNPSIHVARDRKTGLNVPTSICPTNLIDDIYSYFKERNEDDLQKEEDFFQIIEQPIRQPIMPSIEQTIQNNKTTQDSQNNHQHIKKQNQNQNQQRPLFSKGSIFHNVISNQLTNANKVHTSNMYKGFLAK